MITPVIIQAVFWILVAISVIGGLALIVGGDSGGARFLGLATAPAPTPPPGP